MKAFLFLLSLLVLSCGSHSKGGKDESGFKKSFMPENNLHLYDDNSAANMSEETFNRIIDHAYQIYAPIVQNLGGNLVFERNYNDPIVNAYASRSGNDWKVSLFGGLAKRKEVTEDGFALVICHELGHHLNGWVFYPNSWAASEGSSDYYSTASCSKKLFAAIETDTTKVPKCPFAPDASDYDYTPCKGFAFAADKESCQRSLDAALSLSKLLSALGRQPTPSLSTPDKTIVRTTQTTHPNAQCRLDTMAAGVMCEKQWNDTIIPQDKPTMQEVACEKTFPKCWYAG
jgi:hypothetical protein